MVCSLTLLKPDFINDCSEFIMDTKELSKTYAKSFNGGVEGKSGTSISVWGIVAIVFFVIPIIIHFIRD